MSRSITIGLTMGDPAGIGPEVVSQALTSPELPTGAEFRAFGQLPDGSSIVAGRPTEHSARAALAALEAAAEAWRTGVIDAVVTGPICKETLRQIGFEYPGQSEFFADACGTPVEKAVMMMYDPKLTVSLVSTHCSLRDALGLVTAERIETTVEATWQFLRGMGKEDPHLALAALNPHAGEGGHFGYEEQRILFPAVEKLRARRRRLDGPFSPDTVFRRAVSGDFDAVICLYHDQGLIPFKLIAFETGVNVTLGLPIIRTSPDHGTAFEIAGLSQADPRSMLAAIQLAVRMVQNARQ
ncbi:MAG: 4-hydroxythreonine-4-phosphate dehydrogenase PdxA [Verrucomicrobiota bacterium]